MDQYFDIFVKEHLQDILCVAEKEHTLSFIKKHQHHHKAHERAQIKIHTHVHEADVQLQDCAVSPSFSQSHL